MIAKLTGEGAAATARVSRGGGGEMLGGAAQRPRAGVAGKYRGAQGLDPEFIAELEKQFGFDKPA